jgi:lysine N6-hydroxylase
MTSRPTHPAWGRTTDVVGVGVGPANLSLAALVEPIADLDAVFLEQKSEFAWHPGLLLPGTTTQVHFIKDLVTLVDPTSRFSFLAFLAAKKRLYRAVIADRARVSRLEFDEYYRWVASSLESVAFGSPVDAVSWDGQTFVVETVDRTVRARNVVIGTGRPPYVPRCARSLLGRRGFHGNDFLLRHRSLRGERVAIVGGGQTGAEIFHHLLSERSERPERIYWVTKRVNFLPLDDTAFTNELFLPGYSEYFYGLPEEKRLDLLQSQVLSSNGIDADLLESIYRRLYDLECIEGEGRFCRLVAGHELVEAVEAGDRVELMFESLETGAVSTIAVDAVILATGDRAVPSPVLEPLLDRIALSNGRLVVRRDFSLEWDGPPDCRIYVQNAASHQFGIADPNLSLVAWRSATIANSVAGRPVYDLDGESAAIDWAAPFEDADLVDALGERARAGAR